MVDRMSTYSKANNYETSEIGNSPASSRIRKFNPLKTDPNIVENIN